MSAIVGLLTVVYALVKRPFAEAMAAAKVLNVASTNFILLTGSAVQGSSGRQLLSLFDAVTDTSHESPDSA
ncbi:hypothetical protein [Rhizobium herbae]